MNRWKMRGVAALAVISLAIAGCQNEGADPSLDTLPSIDTGIPSHSMDMGSMDESSPSADPSEAP